MKRAETKRQRQFAKDRAVTTTEYACETDTGPSDYLVEELPVRFVHLRCFDIETGELLQNGGITLACTRDGIHQRVGAAFCSLNDPYCRDGVVNGKLVGRSLALQRLTFTPCWVPAWHVAGDYEQTAEFLDSDAGRAWLRTALDHGLNLTWILATKPQRKR